MRGKIFIALLLFATVAGGARLVQIKYPYFYFDHGEHWLQCKPGQGKKDELIRCTAMHKGTRELAPFVCLGAPPEEGYLKQCEIEGDI